MNKLSSRDRQRVTDALSECARQTKEIEDPKKLQDSAYDILANKLGDNPGLFKAACQVYNSCKSIHKLSEATDETRGNNFTILNVQDMATRLADDKKKELRKAASAPSTFTCMRIPSGTMQKAASATTRKPQVKPQPKPEYSASEYKSFMREELDDIAVFINKAASRLTAAEAAAEEALDNFTSCFAVEPPNIRKDAAARLYAHYKQGAADVINAAGEQRPFCKVASADYVNKYVGTPSLPANRLFSAAKDAIEAQANLRKTASNFKTMIQEAAISVVHIGKGYTQYMSKKAAGVEMDTGGVADLLGLNDAKDTENIRKEIYNTDFTNDLVSHSYQRAFMKATMNSAISKYALDKITDAFNRAVAKLPANSRMVPATANQQLIESLMIDELAKGNVASKADAEIITNIADTLGKMKSDSGVYEGNIAGGEDA